LFCFGNHKYASPDGLSKNLASLRVLCAAAFIPISLHAAAETFRAADDALVQNRHHQPNSEKQFSEVPTLFAAMLANLFSIHAGAV